MIVAALAGRRVDAEGTRPASFPAANIPVVQRAIELLFIEEHIELLVCSCAAGADILALQVADRMNIRCRVILPYNIERFRATSVVDRSDAWGKSYDALIANARQSGLLTIIPQTHPDSAAFTETNRVIIHEAISAAYPAKPVAIVIWNGRPRPSDDFTDEFRQLALEAGMRERVILTR